MIQCSKLHISDGSKTLVDISFEIQRSLALVGQSGSGKSLTLKALLDLLPHNLSLDIDIKSDFVFERGKTVSLVPQNPFTSFSPLTKIKKHFTNTKIQRCEELMQMVGLEEEFLERFAPELSGGQLQRVAIALALLPQPKLLLLDEPTTALDNSSKQTILSLIDSLQKELGFMTLFVSHDIKSVQQVCEDIVVLKNGAIVESGKMKDVAKNPQDSYTKELIESSFENRDKRI